jgi:hypothetical protein
LPSKVVGFASDVMCACADVKTRDTLNLKIMGMKLSSHVLARRLLRIRITILDLELVLLFLPIPLIRLSLRMPLR